MHKFSFQKGALKLRNIKSIKFGTQYREGNLWLVLDVKLKNGKVMQVGGVQLTGLDRPQSEVAHVSLELPTERDWKALKPDELSINVGFVSAKWKLK